MIVIMTDNQMTDDLTNDEPQYLTQDGAKALREELETLVNVKRAELAIKLNDAIAMGDLSENADYHDTKEQQAFLEYRIRYLESVLRNAKIIDEDGQRNDAVRLGSEVTIQEDGSEAETYKLVGPAEANPREGRISHESPLGKALLGKKVQSKVKVQTPDGELVFRIVKIN
jgi:transcription elongation factor GreA